MKVLHCYWKGCHRAFLRKLFRDKGREFCSEACRHKQVLDDYYEQYKGKGKMPK